MPKLTLAVRVAAGSLLLFSLAHVLFWGILAFSTRANLPNTFPYNYIFPILCIFSATGSFGVLVAVGVFCARNWARISLLVLGAIILLFCAFALLACVVMIFVPSSLGLGVEVPVSSRGALLRLVLFYLFVFSVSLWWILLFSRKSVAAQFTSATTTSDKAIPARSGCPPPIKLLARLMILSSALSAFSWPLILGKIPAMLFTHIFSAETSKWIWAANIVLFLVSGVGLLRLQRWSYTGTIALHAFWLVSLFVSQLSSGYRQYLNLCMAALQASDTIALIHFHFPEWISAVATALPTALLIVGLLYYRRAFLKATAEAGH